MGSKTIISFDDYNPPTYDEYDGDDPKPGWYDFDLQKMSWASEDQDSIRWIFVIAEGPFAGWAGFIYGNFDSTKWKNQEVARAIQGGKETPLSVDLDNDKSIALVIKKAQRVRGKVELFTNKETGDQRLQLRKVRPLDGGSVKGNKVAEVDADVEPEVDVIEDYTEAELTDMDLKELKAILKDEFGFQAKELREIKTSKAAIKAILEEQEADEEGEDATEEDEDEEAADGGTDDATDEDDFDDDFDDSQEEEAEPEPEPARRRRGTAPAAKEAPAKKAAPAKAAAEVPAQRRRARR